MKYFDVIAMGLPITRKSKPDMGFIIQAGGHFIRKDDGKMINLTKDDFEALDWVAGDIDDIFLSISKTEFMKVAESFFNAHGVVNEHTPDDLWDTFERYCSNEVDEPIEDEDEEVEEQ